MTDSPSADNFASRISGVMWDAHEFLTKFKSQHNNDPEPGSLAYEEIHNSSESGPGGPWKSDDIYSAYSMTLGILIPAADQLLCSECHLYREPMALYGFQVVGRALAESAARAWWLVQADIPLRTRMARLYNQRWENCEEARKAGALLGEDATAATARSLKLRAEGASLGLDEKFEKRRDGTQGRFIGYQDGRCPTSTELVDLYFKALNSPNGEVWYRTMSAICHGTAYGLLTSFNDSYSGTPGRVTLSPNLTPAALTQVATMSVEMCLGAMQFLATSFGWESAEVEQKRAFSRNVLLSMAQDRTSGRG